MIEELERIVLLSGVGESEPNNQLALASPFSVTEDPAGSQFYTATGTGALSPASDDDYWRFEALAGQRVTVAGYGGSGGSAVSLELRDANDVILDRQEDTATGRPQITDFTIPTTGSYYVRARTNNGGQTLDAYEIRVDISAQPDLEREGNDSASSASVITLRPGGDSAATGTLAGNINLAR